MAADVISLAAHPRALDRLFAGEPAELILSYVLKELAPGRVAVVASFGAESAVLLHLVASVDPATPVIFLDTLNHFPETIAHRDRLVAHLGLGDVRSVQPDPERVAAVDPAGTLHALNADACCALRKSAPLDEALQGFDVWITGRKRHQATSRRAMPLFERDGARIKVNPLGEWGPVDIADYLAARDLPAHPLVAHGYASIGCAPCTGPIRAGEHPRAGRWRGAAKTECGIHLSHNGSYVRTLTHAGVGS
jgi:phosphoadenosine phosphosulfate reductase